MARQNSTPDSSIVSGASSGTGVVVFEDDEWATQVARRLITKLAADPSTRLCLPTGQTPRPMYEACASSIDMSGSTVFLLDEFGLPVNSPGRCDSMLQRDLLGSLRHQPAEYHRLDVDAPAPDEECARFDALVEDGGLDLTLLGLGGNGHLGLNEPGTQADSPTRTVEVAQSTADTVRGYDADAEVVGGMTLGLHRIMASDEIRLLVTGSHKAAILDKMLNGPIGSDLPASFLRNHPNTIIYADRSAASML